MHCTREKKKAFGIPWEKLRFMHHRRVWLYEYRNRWAQGTYQLGTYRCFVVLIDILHTIPRLWTTTCTPSHESFTVT